MQQGTFGSLAPSLAVWLIKQTAWAVQGWQMCFLYCGRLSCLRVFYKNDNDE